ncbi:S1C family serine protease [Streptomyces hoynatensis]|uniref:Serine protease n=1 Tax=Streptomyces hoynatensis TaxID=1141874 RepID=A0A3A9Z0T3_9ACTN|nr:trypsin-like peptidase domain-containing protein [Streptomyces hoynatensis]RKN41795.1 serine protease [Streptomyces hoynatensis]
MNENQAHAAQQPRRAAWASWTQPQPTGPHAGGPDPAGSPADRTRPGESGRTESAPGAFGPPPAPPYALDPPQDPQAAGSGTGEWPPPPARPPARRRVPRWARGPVALFAAGAIVAGAVGGGTAALLDDGPGRGGSASSSALGTAVSTDGTQGSVAAVARAVGPAVVEISTGSATGSGVVVTSDGSIVTNNHVVTGADSVQVTFSDGSTATASVTATDPERDLALIKASGAEDLTPVTLGDSDGVAVGDEVVAIGSPEGLTGTVTSGIVSALDREVTVPADDGSAQQDGQWPFEFGGGRYNGDVGESTTTYKAIQTDASLNPGNSGGALVNLGGELIGLNSAMYSTSSDAGSAGLGFAIPVDTVRDFLQEQGVLTGGTA